MDRPPARALEVYLVERYWPGIDLTGLHAVIGRLDNVAREMTVEGHPVEHVGSILMPVDEVVFSLMAAGDETLVREANARAGLPVHRITVAISLIAAADPNPAGGSRP